jgi:glycosyltransferase XagB
VRFEIWVNEFYGISAVWFHLITTKVITTKAASELVELYQRTISDCDFNCGFNIKYTSMLTAVLASVSIFLFIQVSYSTYLKLYTWNDVNRRHKYQAPARFIAPQKSFTVLLPARHEEAVIQQTIQGVLDTHYPQELLEIVVVCRVDDQGTIAKVRQKLTELEALGINNVRLVIFADQPINKPHGCNVALRYTQNDVVTLFDAEDQVHPDIFNVVNTVMVTEGFQVVQAGVQLMNFDSRWFSVHNVLEYFFWFKSSLYYYAELGMIPLGGNTVFFNRQLLNLLGGWDETCLTEDADIGIRLSIRGESVRVVYEDVYVTQEETPPTISHFIRQRSRWNQGFFQILRRGDYWKLPYLRQKLLALYTLSSPIFLAVTMFYLPISLYTIVFVKMPASIALLVCLPAYMLFGQFLLSLAGLYEFADAHGIKLRLSIWLKLFLTFYPYQILLGIGALRAVYRELKGVNTWEKTQHLNAHRNAQ